MKILYARNAINDLERLYHFIAKDNPAAKDIALKLQQASTRLIDFPLLGKKAKSAKKSDSIRDLITGNYVIRYAAMKSEIHILRVWHGKEEELYSI